MSSILFVKCRVSIKRRMYKKKKLQKRKGERKEKEGCVSNKFRLKFIMANVQADTGKWAKI